MKAIRCFAVLFALCLSGVIQAQIIPSANPKADSVAFAKGYCWPLSATAQMDMRYRFYGKIYLTVRAGLFKDGNNLDELLVVDPIYAYGAVYSRQTIVGPLKIAAQ